MSAEHPTDLFTGLSAFPLTPLDRDELDERALAGILRMLVAAGVDSIAVLGSTGSGPYLSREERRSVLRLAATHAAGTPVIAGVGALRTADAVRNARDAEALGAAGLLLAPLSYQPLDDDEVFGLFAEVAAATELPIVLYDNPATTRFAFSDQLLARIGAIPTVAAVKIPPLPGRHEDAVARLAELRGVLPEGVRIGVSGDAAALGGLRAGADAWYSVIGGTLPEPALALVRAVERGDASQADRIAASLAPLWELNARHGSLRVAAAVAAARGIAPEESLPKPLLGLSGAARERVGDFVASLGS